MLEPKSQQVLSGSTVVATLFLTAPAGCDFLRVERTTGGINAGPFVVKATDPSVGAPVAQRVKIDVHAHCSEAATLMGLLDLLGKLQPGVVIRRKIVRIGNASADALVIFAPEPSDSEHFSGIDGDFSNTSIT
jgi:hypothetical protein